MTEARVDPPSGLGNFKGVMLCNRPDEGPRAADAGPPPFKSAVAPTANDQLGLNPPKKDPRAQEKPKNPALVRHCGWLKQLQKEMREARKEAEDEEAKIDDKHRKVKEFCAKQRDQVRLLREESKKVNGLLDKKKVANVVQGKRPKWSMTEKAAEEFDEGETVELLDFAENLNYDEYMNDFEFRDALQQLKGRADRIAREQDAFRKELCEKINDDESVAEAPAAEDAPIEDAAVEGESCMDASDAPSSAGAVERRQKSEKSESDWDASTRTSEMTGTSVDSERSSVVDAALQNREIRSVHSRASVEKIIEKQAAKKAAEAGDKEAAVQRLVQALGDEKTAPAPLIQVCVENERGNKPTDPSMLPYLYRSPAV